MARKIRVKNKATARIGRPTGNALFNAYTPWTPSMPPAGAYDPAIDASVGSAQRGNRYLVGGIGGVQGAGSGPR